MAEEATELQDGANKVQRWWLRMVRNRADAMGNAGLKMREKVGMIGLGNNNKGFTSEVLQGESGYDDDISLYTEVTWEECVDEEEKTFYYNTVTGESKWERPRGMGVVILNEESGGNYGGEGGGAS